MHAFQTERYKSSQPEWPHNAAYHRSNGIKLKCPARDPYEDAHDDDAYHYRWYQDNWSAVVMNGKELPREWPRDPEDDASNPYHGFDEYGLGSRSQHDRGLDDLLRRQAARVALNRKKLKIARERMAKWAGPNVRKGYDQDFAHNVIEFRRGEVPRHDATIH